MMTETIAPADSHATESPRLARPETDGAALRAIDEATAHVRDRALQIRQNPEEHKPRLVLSQHVRGTSLLDRIASKDMPGRQRHIQDCVDQILAEVDPKPAAS
jgi:hypothetical protein